MKQIKQSLRKVRVRLKDVEKVCFKVLPTS